LGVGAERDADAAASRPGFALTKLFDSGGFGLPRTPVCRCRHRDPYSSAGYGNGPGATWRKKYGRSIRHELEIEHADVGCCMEGSP